MIKSNILFSITALLLVQYCSPGGQDVLAQKVDPSTFSEKSSSKVGNLELVTYYVDNIAGNDVNDGLSPDKAWKTLTKVNATTFGANNKLLFKAGGVWTGRLYPKGSGIQGSPVVIDKYGTGNKPLIDGAGMTGTGVVYLYNQQYWEINNLEITNNAVSGADRRGVRIEAENIGTVNHIYLKDLNIHNIKGKVGQGRTEKRTSGIGFGIVSASQKETHFNDILIDNCVITACDNQGIITECVADDGFDPYTPEWNRIKITNAVIRNNTISQISKNAMIIRLFEGGVIENNVCFNTANGITGNTIFSAACSGTVFQYNEGYDNNSPDADGCLYDADLRSPNTTWQYSYSHDNAHGLFWTCTVQTDVNVVCRYNISQNDQGIIFCINYPVTSCNIYNNTVYIPANLSPLIISERNNGGSGTRTYTFHNNLIYNLSPTASYGWTNGYNRTIDYNCFFGVHPSTEPADPHKVITDPKLVNPGSGGKGMNSVTGYKLQPGSSCINKGKVIANNGGKDYWGNPLYNGLPDIGAHEFVQSSAPASYTMTGGGSYCQGDDGLPVGLSDSEEGVNYTLIKDGTATSLIVPGTGGAISFGNQFSGNYTTTGAASGSVTSITGTAAMSGSTEVTVDPLPPAPVVTQSGDTLISNAPASNQWFKNGDKIPATGRQYVVTSIGEYTSKVTLNGCSSLPSNSIIVIQVGLNKVNPENFEIYPNPCYGRFRLKFEFSNPDSYSLFVYNEFGTMVWKQSQIVSCRHGNIEVNLKDHPPGVYSVALIGSKANSYRKLLIMN